MTTFVANSQLDMYQFLTRADLLGLFNAATVISHTATKFQIKDVADTQEVLTLTGSFGGYTSDFYPTTGTVTGGSYLPGNTGFGSFTFSSASISVGDFTNYVNASNTVGLFQQILQGNDQITGSGSRDILYGFNGDDTLDGGGGNDAMVGGLGNDTYIVDNIGDTTTENAGTGTGVDTVKASVTYTLLANVENLILTGSAAINGTGNSLANVITGNSAANTLDGAGGSDHLIGGDGNDIYIVDDPGVVVTEAANQGIDTVHASISYVLGSDLEHLDLTGNAAINGTGNELSNEIIGNDASNILDGKGGADHMSGAGGDDTYIVDNSADVVTETAPDEGTDLVLASATFTLAENVDNLTLTGSAAIDGTGNDLANIIIGNSAANSLSGGGDNDVLDGRAGADTMSGGDGNDIFYVDDSGDTVHENSDEGTDLVYASVNFTLGSDVDNLTLVGTAPIDGTGNDLANVITGNTEANLLDGGAGGDTLTGGLGNDTYHVDNVGDVVIEAGAEGTDTVESSITYLLTANVENLTLVGPDAIDGTGNLLDNIIIGNANDNVLDGGMGADKLTGGDGHDTYVVDYIGDVITENADEGIDTVNSAISWALGANLENLTLIGVGSFNGTGNALDNVIVGNSASNQLDGAAGADTLVGGGGSDTYYVENSDDVVVEFLNEGTTDWVYSSVDWILSANVENLTLTGGAAINGTGNELANSIFGNAAANILDGGAGADQLAGGAGDDTYVVDNSGDQVVENPGEGIDLVNALVTFALGSNVENLTLTGSAAIDGTGNILANVIRGNNAANTLDGGAGNDTIAGNGGDDTLIGGTGNDSLNGGIGADTMIGGIGNDTYTVDHKFDVVTENAGEGTDTVISSIDYVLGANVENLSLTGFARMGTGNELANVIRGTSGDDTLDGGAGADKLYGGAGNDTYIADSSSDRIAEAAGGGTDTVLANVTYTIGSYVENLSLTGTAAIGGTGNSIDNLLSGNDAANTLNGLAGHDTLFGNGGNDWLDGGTGADDMQGGVGNDTYTVDNVGDVVTENAGEGTDLVRSSISYALGSQVENLTLIGTGNINGTGNELVNTIRGNDGNNILDGGVGADKLYGGGGDDTFIVDNAGDGIAEAAGGGTDTVQASASYTLGANVENLSLTGSDSINGTGNSLDNVIIGNSGDNVLKGGAGIDHLTGAAGNDSFVFDDGHFGGTTADTADEITDFTTGDKLDLHLVDANSLVGGDQAFAFIGTEAFHNVAGELRYEQVSGTTFVYGDTNGDGVADFMVKLDGAHVLTGADIGI